MNDLIFRKAKLEDQAYLRILEQKVVEAERPFNDSIKLEGAIYYDLEQLINDDSSYLLVAEANNRIIGTGYAQIRDSKKSLKHQKHSYLGFMFVEPDYRGLGINKLIMDNLMEWSKAQGILDFYLDVYDGNDAAIRAYEKVGFTKSLIEMKINLGK